MKNQSLSILNQFLDIPDEDDENSVVVEAHPLIHARDILDTFSHSQEVFLIAKLYGSSDKQSALAAGIKPATVYGWKKKTDFKDIYDRIVDNPVLIAAESVAFATAKAISKLIRMLDHRSVEVQQYAINTLLNLSRATVERKEVKVTHDFDLDGAYREFERLRQERESLNEPAKDIGDSQV